jgi:hypothetical protein
MKKKFVCRSCEKPCKISVGYAKDRLRMEKNG